MTKNSVSAENTARPVAVDSEKVNVNQTNANQTDVNQANLNQTNTNQANTNLATDITEEAMKEDNAD